jgi:hypothetical protein
MKGIGHEKRGDRNLLLDEAPHQMLDARHGAIVAGEHRLGLGVRRFL